MTDKQLKIFHDNLAKYIRRNPDLTLEEVSRATGTRLAIVSEVAMKCSKCK